VPGIQPESVCSSVTCERCGAVRCSDKLRGADLPVISHLMVHEVSLPHAEPGGYRKWKDWAEDRFGQFTSSEAAYFRAELRELSARRDGTPRILEIGFGNGAFAGWCRSKAWAWMGTEIDSVLVDRARQAGYRAECAQDGLGPLRAGSPFDLIVAWDVFEHIAPGATLKLMADLNSLLSDSGALVFRVPSGDSPFSRAIQHTDPTHAQILTSHAARIMAQEAGFRECTARNTRLPIFVPSLRGIVRRVGVRLVDAIVHRAVKVAIRDATAVITPNMVVVAFK
jgi:hypothetical protein